MANIIASGDWWRFEDDGTLYVYCTGDMPDYGFSPPWSSNLRRIRAVEIANSVTSISALAFYNCGTLASVTIPDSVTSIGSTAFYYCLSLTSVTIPDSVTSIGNGAFKDCRALESVTISNSVTIIGGLTFSGCSSLISVTIPDSVTKIEAQAFYGCSSLESVTIPVSVTNIGAYAFDECGALTDIYYGGSKAGWDTISIGSDNAPLINDTIHYSATFSSIAVTTPPTKATYAEGEAFDPSGMIVTATYSNASTRTVTGYSVSPSGSLTAFDRAITVSYTEDGITATATTAITVTVNFSTSWPRSARDVMREIAYRIGTPLDPRTSTILGTDEIEDTALKMSMRQVAGYIAAMYGGNWTVTDDGYLYLVPLGMAAQVLGDENGVPILFGEALLLV